MQKQNISNEPGQKVAFTEKASICMTKRPRPTQIPLRGFCAAVSVLLVMSLVLTRSALASRICERQAAPEYKVLGLLKMETAIQASSTGNRNQGIGLARLDGLIAQHLQGGFALIFLRQTKVAVFAGGVLAKLGRRPLSRGFGL